MTVRSVLSSKKRYGKRAPGTKHVERNSRKREYLPENWLRANGISVFHNRDPYQQLPKRKFDCRNRLSPTFQCVNAFPPMNSLIPGNREHIYIYFLER